MLFAGTAFVFPTHAVIAGISVFLLEDLISAFKQQRHKVNFTMPSLDQEVAAREEVNSTTESSTTNSTSNFRYYRYLEIQRVVASLKGNASIIVTGESGSGKSVVGKAAVQQLLEEGYQMAFIETATPKQMLVEIAEQLSIDTHSLAGKALTAEDLKVAIAHYFQKNVAFLVIDDAHMCELKFRVWLKSLKRQKVPMLLIATEPPKADIFLNLPRLELKPLPNYAIREVMEQAARERNFNLRESDFARLQERTGGNPMLAIRAVEEEYLGLDVEAGDHTQYLDVTPLVLLVGAIFIIVRFVGLGTGNQALYMIGGMAAAVFLTINNMLRSVPPEGGKIR